MLSTGSNLRDPGRFDQLTRLNGQLSAGDAALSDMMHVLSLTKEAQTSINHSFIV
jgi:hypothetical protein